MTQSLERVVVQRNGRWVAVYVPVEEEMHVGAVPQYIKAEAERRIFQRVPQWRQSNLTARMVELLKVGQSNWDAEQQAEVDAMVQTWEWVKSIRARSNELEAMIVGMTLEQIQELGLFDDAMWETT